jgi:hypothetical protein
MLDTGEKTGRDREGQWSVKERKDSERRIDGRQVIDHRMIDRITDEQRFMNGSVMIDEQMVD